MPTSSIYTEVSVHCCNGKHSGEFANFIVWSRTIYSFTCIVHGRIYCICMYVQYMQGVCLTENSKACLVVCSSRYNGSLVAWTVLFLTAAKFKPHIFFCVGNSPCPMLRIFIFSWFCMTFYIFSVLFVFRWYRVRISTFTSCPDWDLSVSSGHGRFLTDSFPLNLWSSSHLLRLCMTSAVRKKKYCSQRFWIQMNQHVCPNDWESLLWQSLPFVLQ
jgi:hypothetical protein